MANNNAYLRVKLAQLEAQKAALRAELKRIAEKHKAYSEQLVDEPEEPTSTEPDSGTED
jgi:hypothetical protein